MKIIPYSILTSLGYSDDFNYTYYVMYENGVKEYPDDQMIWIHREILEKVKNNITETRKFWAKNRRALDEENFYALVKSEYESNIKHIQFCKKHEEIRKNNEECKKDFEKFKAWFEEDGHSKEEKLQKLEDRFFGLGKKITTLNFDLSNLDLPKNQMIIH